MKRTKMKTKIATTVLALLFSAGGLKVNYRASAATVEEQAANVVGGMTLEEKVGQMFVPDFRNWGFDSKNNRIPFTVMNDDVKSVIQKYHLGGVILFAENVKETEQTVRLVEGMQQASEKVPLLITIDQEGGIVRRLQTGTGMPGNMALGATRSTDLSYKSGKVIGEELKALGINVDFAPDLDVNINPSNPVIGVRSFGSDPKLVADLGTAYIKGVQDSGVAATGKHFPGHGDTATDSHLGLPVVNHDIDTINKIDLVPFKAAMDKGIDMIMTAHVAFPAVDDSTAISKKDGTPVNIPATLSKKVLTDLIRTKMGYKGVITTDALNMLAIADHFGQEDAVKMAINAGTDIVLMPAVVQSTGEIANLDKIYNSVVSAVKTGEIPESRINESARRIIELKLKRGIYNPAGNQNQISLEQKISSAKAVVGSTEHKAVEKEASEKAVTLLRNENNMLPFKLESGKKIVLFSLSQYRIKSMTDSINDISSKNSLDNITIQSFIYSSKAATLTDTQKAAIDAADFVITNSVNMAPDPKTGTYYDIDFINSVSAYANSKNIAIVNIAVRNPYDIAYTPNVKACIAIYGGLGNDPTNPPPAPNLPAGINAIFGMFNPTGKLPVAVPNPQNNKENMLEFGFGLIYEQTKKDAESLIEKAKKSLIKSDLDNARSYVSALPDNSDKVELLNKINNVQKDVDKAISAESAVAKAEKSLVQADLDEANKLIAELPDSDMKTGLSSRTKSAQDKINLNTKINDAVQAVIKAENSLSQEDLDSAKKLMDNLEDGETKVSLLGRINAAQSKIDVNVKIKKAEEALNKAKDNLSQSDLNAAKATIDSLPDSQQKTDLLQKYKEVQEDINEKSTSVQGANTSVLPKTGSALDMSSLILFGILVSSLGVLIIKRK